MVLQIPGRQVWWQQLDLEAPGRGARHERPLQNRPEHGGIALRPDPQPVIEIALRPEVLRRDQHAPAGPERPRKTDAMFGRVTVEGDVHAPRLAEQRQPRRLPAAGAAKPARASVPQPAARIDSVQARISST